MGFTFFQRNENPVKRNTGFIMYFGRMYREEEFKTRSNFAVPEMLISVLRVRLASEGETLYARERCTSFINPLTPNDHYS